MDDFDINIDDKLTIKGLIGVRKIAKSHKKYKKGNGSPNPKYNEKFIEYGDIDYEAARVLFSVQDRDYDFMNQASFLCAQAAEKYLKAFLFWKAPEHFPGLSGRNVLDEFAKLSHDLEKILGECVEEDNGFENLRLQIKKINKYSLLKYPDIEDEMIYSDEGLSISSDMLKDVGAVGDFIKKIINN